MKYNVLASPQVCKLYFVKIQQATDFQVILTSLYKQTSNSK